MTDRNQGVQDEGVQDLSLQDLALQGVERSGAQPPGAFSSATAWMSELAFPAALAWCGFSRRVERQAANAAIAGLPAAFSALRALSPLVPPLPALSALLADGGLLWLRNEFGKPYIAVAQEDRPCSAADHGMIEQLHVSNSHDGGLEFVLAATDTSMRGIGLDIVYLPRLRRPGKDRTYLERFAGQFMSDVELEYYMREAADENDEALLIRTAAHFSIMEATSKALGTGLKLGVGMGGAYSLPKSSIAIAALHSTSATLNLNSVAAARMNSIGADSAAAYWGFDDEFVISAVILHGS